MLTTYTNAARESERGYYAFGSDRRVVGTPATDHRFTGQKQDGSGLYYYNARYYDPVIGQFVSPDTLMPEPGRVDGYNRYMYVMGNPLRYNDPTGHCKMLADGERDWEGDGACWQTAFAIYGYGHTEQSFAEDWNVSPDAWLQNIAGQDYATVEYLQPFHDKYAQEFRSRTGLNTAVPGSHSASPQHPLEASVEFCREHDCVGGTLNTIGVVASTIAVACASSLVGNAGCSEVASYVSFTAGAIATARTAATASKDEATVLDLTVSVGTVIAGGVPIVGQSNKGIGLLAAVFQAAWDGGLSNRVATGGGVQ